MKKYTHVHDYFENMKEIVATFSLKGKPNIWCEDLKNFKNIRVKELCGRRFERYF